MLLAFPSVARDSSRKNAIEINDKAAVLAKPWSAVMGKALDKLIEDVVLDEDRADAVKAHVAK